MRLIPVFCIIGMLYCLMKSCSIDSDAQSVMHQLYAGQYTLMAVLFLCCGFIVDALLEQKKSGEKTSSNKKKKD